MQRHEKINIAFSKIFIKIYGIYMQNISPAEMITWFKAKAAEFNRIARELESTFSPNGQPIPQALKKDVDVDAVRNALHELGRPSRYSAVAEHLKADANAVWDILNSNPNVFEQSGRGWWKQRG